MTNRALWVRLGMGAVALAATVICVEAWKPPFPYRIGDFADHGIVARVDFRRIDRVKTERARSDAEAQTPYVFRNEPEPLNILPARLRANLRQIADAKSLADVPLKTRGLFGLTTEGTADTANPKEPSLEQEFAALRKVVTDNPDTPGNRIDDVIADFEKFTAVLKNRGLADVNEFTENKIRADQSLAIATGSGKPPEIVFPADVQLSELLKETGALGKTWPQFPRLFACRRSLERWLVSQAPVTLSYDGASTQQARREAREKAPPVMDDYLRGTVLVPARQVIDEERLARLNAEYDELASRIGTGNKVLRVITVAVMLLILAVLNWLYLDHNEPQMLRNVGRLFVYLTMVV